MSSVWICTHHLNKMVEAQNYSTLWSVTKTLFVVVIAQRNANKTLSFGFAWDSMHSFSLPLQYVVTVMNLPPTPLLHLCRSGNIINQYINKQLGRLISENAHTNTHIHKHILHGWCIVTDLERSPGQTRSHRPCGTAGQPSSGAPNWGTTHTSTSPLFLEKQKKHIMGHGEYTHTFTPTHIQSHWSADIYYTMCKHTVRTSMDQGQFMSLWRSSNHNSHTGHTRHSHALSVKTYRTVQTLRTHEQELTHMRKFHLMVSKAPFSHSHQWFSFWGNLMVKYLRQEKQKLQQK